MFTPGEHEEIFEVKPVGVKYICEFCNKGEMKVKKEGLVLTSNPPLITHICTECGKEMQLPKVYPYIEWLPVEDTTN